MKPHLEVEIIPALKDNYIFLVHDPVSEKTLVIDPSEPKPVQDALLRRKWKLDIILNTHHHWDHIGGNLALKNWTGARVVGPAPDAARIPGMDDAIHDGEPLRLGDWDFLAMHVPGHTTGHTIYYASQAQYLFCGDTLFTLGCGFLFEGTPDQMWTSLDRIRKLPPETKVFCAHEYTLENAEFALHFDGDNPHLQKYVKRAEGQRAKGLPTIPSTLAEECAANPFLRADSEEFRRKLNMEDATPAELFWKVRRLKNEFDDRKKLN